MVPIVHGEKIMVQINPNPFSSTLNLVCTLGEPSYLNVVLMDVTGRLIFESNHFVDAGNSTLKMDGLQPLAAGNYFIRIRNLNDGEVGVYKLVK